VREITKSELPSQSICWVVSSPVSVREALAGRVHDAAPDEPDDRKRQDHREVQQALIERGAPQVLVEQIRHKHAKWRCNQEQEDEHPRVVEQGLVEVFLKDRKELLVVAQPDELHLVEPEAVPVRE